MAEQPRERAVPCRNATPEEAAYGRHTTWNNDAICDRCRKDGPDASKWVHIEVWAERTWTLTDDAVRDLFDDIAHLTYGWGERQQVDPHVGGRLNADPPDWAKARRGV